MIQLDETCTQAEFGALLGITQQAVSDMVARGVLIPGDTLAGWIRNRDEHLRNQAAGRDSELAKERAIATRVARERNEIKLATDRGEFAPVTGIELVLATVGRTVGSRLEQLPGKLSRLCPELTPQAVAAAQREVSAACDDAVNASLDLLAKLEAEAQEMDAAEAARVAELSAGDAGDDGLAGFDD